MLSKLNFLSAKKELYSQTALRTNLFRIYIAWW
jgi:hypothetical protein